MSSTDKQLEISSNTMEVQNEQKTTKQAGENQHAMQQHISKLLKQLGAGMHEREQVCSHCVAGGDRWA